ncbi:trypsin-like serine peptidase [Nonomuraea mangrovi]|uniref:Trypsin-like serine peptidase n=1 Tax=Nonomuraea mangrovi TaxID=2316207 RepID=A0ABW4T507_9ACTN
MKRLLIPLAAAGLAAATLAAPAAAAPSWVTDPLAPKPADAYSTALFWLDANGAALKKAAQYHWDYKNITKLVRVSSDTPDDGKPGVVAPIGAATTGGKVKNVNLPKTIGKVFFVDSKGDYRWCSATSVQSRHRNLVATAGHCVYERGRDVFAKWVFVPGYYQGKAPFGVFAGAYAFTTYDLDTYDDYDGDFAFVAVHNGFDLPGSREVSPSEFAEWKGDKWVDNRWQKVAKDDYEKGVNAGRLGRIVDGVATQTTGPEDKRGVFQPKEVSSETYDDAAGLDVTRIGAKARSTTTVLSDQEAAEYQSLKALTAAQRAERFEKNQVKYWDKSESFLGTVTGGAGSAKLTRYYVKQWIIPGADAAYFLGDPHFMIGLAKDTGKLGDTVGGQGMAWNQPQGQPVFAFGYPADEHPDGSKPYTGVTPKYCYGKTGTKTYQVNSFRVETHQVLKCSMTGGADGGPWLLKYNNSKRLGYVNGVTSLFHDQDGNDRVDLISSAYFDGETADVYNKAQYAETKSIIGPKGEMLS